MSAVKAYVASLNPTSRNVSVQVRIGSYPNTDMGSSEYKVKLQFESRDTEALAQVVAAAEQQLQTFRR